MTMEAQHVGQNGRPRGPQMEMSSLILTIQLLGYLILTHTHLYIYTYIYIYVLIFSHMFPYPYAMAQM